MNRFTALVVFACSTLAPLAAQERLASVQLVDGRKLEGKVLEMDLEHLAVEVDGKVLRLPASSIRNCRFRDGDDPATQALKEDEQAERSALAAGEAGTSTSTTASPTPPPEHDAAAAVAAAPLGEPAPAVTWTGPLQDPIDPTSPANVPVDLRDRYHLRRRIDALDRAYPWLAPAAPSQWISLGLLLLVGSGLVVHMAVRVSGADRPRLGRSVGLGVYYLTTALAQVALVPVNDLSVSVMVLINGSMSLFLLCMLFGLTRGQAIVAQVVQLGFCALVFAILELVSSLLGTMGISP